VGLLELAALGAAIGVDVMSVGVGIGLTDVPRRRLYQVGSVFALATAASFALGCALATVFRGLLHYVPGRVGAGPLEYVAPEGAAAWVTVAAAAILLGLGLQMVTGKGGSLRLVPGPVAVKGVWSLLGLAALVSVDAVSAGLSLGMLDAARAGRAVAVVGAVNGAMAFLGLGLGRKMRSALHRRLRSAGGFILIALALKLLFHRF